LEKVEVLLYVEKLKRVFLQLKEAVERARDDLDRDGVIQRFEFSVELFWNTLKKVLEYNKVECYSPIDCVKKAFRYGMIDDDEIVLEVKNPYTNIDT
jgi:nucleotidyltransferase substrate binding protein (TIGR01987 family)